MTYLLYVAILVLAVREDARPAPVPGGYRVVLRDRPFVRLALTNVAMIAVGWGVFTWIVPPYAREEIGVGPRLIGILLFANALTVVLAQIPVARLAEGRRRAVWMATGALPVRRRLPARARRGPASATRRAARGGGPRRLRRVLPHDGADAARRRPGPARAARALHGDDRALLVARPRARADAGNAAVGASRRRRRSCAAGVAPAAGLAAFALERELPSAIRLTPRPDDRARRVASPGARARRTARIRRVGDLEIVIAALFVSAAGLNALANWLEVPYPIPLVLGGLVLGLVPGIPDVQLDPDLVLLVFLPPLLYSSAFFADLRALREDARVITLSAHRPRPGDGRGGRRHRARVDRPAVGDAFALGAIVAPTDPAAATAIMRRIGAPRRMVNILEGESLFNDATALVAYKLAVAAAVGETFSAGHTVLEFFLEAGGGIAIGLAVGWVIGEVRKRVTDINTEFTISLFSAYGAFIPADQLGVSGVLAVVACGVYLGFRAPEIASPESRMQADGLWAILAFLLNAVLFILIGLQLPVDRRRAQRPPHGRGDRLCGGGLRGGDRVRFAVELPRHLHHPGVDRRPWQRARRADWRTRVIGSWAGMRGAVSLAAALALPLTTDAGDAAPGRELISSSPSRDPLHRGRQGLTLPWLIRRLGVIDDGTEEENEEVRARL